LYLQSQGDDKDVKIRSDDGSGGLTEYFRADGSVGKAQMFYYGTKTLETTSTGIDVTGNATFADNGKAIFGAGSDLQIYHDGHSYIKDLGAGNLSIMSDGAGILMEKTDGENIAFFDTVNSNVELFESGIKRLETTSTGVDITGTLTSDGLTVSAASLPKITLSDTDGGFDDVSFTVVNGGRDLQIVSPQEVVIKDAGTAANWLRIDEGDISFYEDTGTTAKFFWDASAESLGIGTTDISSNSGSYGLLRIGSGGTLQGYTPTNNSNIFLAENAVRNSAGNWEYLRNDLATNYRQGDGVHSWSYASSGSDGATITFAEAMRISSDGSCRWTPDGTNHDMTLDASGNLLVGKTSASDTGAGVTIQGVGKISAVRDGGISAKFVRETSDGSIVEFVKDTTTVGSIGTSGGDVYIGTGANASVRFNDGVGALTPASGTANADNAVNLGYSSLRWKDLYLSGGVYLGGTGSANKLDDYEEGTWTPSYSSASGLSNITGFTNIEGKYVKIGDMVFAVAAFDLTTTGSETIAEGDYIVVSGLPIAGEKIGERGINGLIGTINVYGSLGNNVNGTGFAQLASTSDRFYFFVQKVNGALDTDDHCFVNLAYST
jgi:hypothetical protein